MKKIINYSLKTKVKESEFLDMKISEERSYSVIVYSSLFLFKYFLCLAIVMLPLKSMAFFCSPSILTRFVRVSALEPCSMRSIYPTEKNLINIFYTFSHI